MTDRKKRNTQFYEVNNNQVLGPKDVRITWEKGQTTAKIVDDFKEGDILLKKIDRLEDGVRKSKNIFYKGPEQSDYPFRYELKESCKRDEGITLGLIKRGYGEIVVALWRWFYQTEEDLKSINSKTIIRIINTNDMGGKRILEYLEYVKKNNLIVKGLNEDVLIALLINQAKERGDRSYRVMDLMGLFGQISNKVGREVLDKCDPILLLENIDKIPGLDHNVLALKVIEKGDIYKILHAVGKDGGLKGLNNEIAEKLIESRGSGIYDILNNIEYFNGLDQEILLKMLRYPIIRLSYIYKVFQNISRFQGIDIDTIIKELNKDEGNEYTKEMFKEIDPIEKNYERIGG